MFKEGDKVRIRQWDDMAREFGYDGDEIDCNCAFIKSMRPLCGMEFTINSVDEGSGIVTFAEEPPELFGKHNRPTMKYTITTDMIEPSDATKAMHFLDDSALLGMIL